MHKRSLFLLVVLLLATGGVVSLVKGMAFAARAAENAVTRYVAAGGSDDGNDCASKTNPCETLQHAVDIALPGDDIWMAAGTYSDVNMRAGITQVAYLSQSLTIQGGYMPDFAAPPDPVANPTILDAGGLGRVIYITGTPGVTLAGLQITGGKIITLSNNRSGGGLYVENAAVILQDSVISGNLAERGGGLYALESVVTATANTLAGNVADYGGGLYIQFGESTLAGNTISDNEARLGGGGVRLYSNSAVLDSNTISSNTSGLHGGGLYLSLSAAVFNANTIHNNLVTTPDQGWGGGMHLHRSDATLNGNAISENEAHTGGGLRLYQSNATLDANLVQNNRARIGGGLSLEVESDATLHNNAIVDNQVTVAGGGLYIVDSSPGLRHTTLARNSGGDGSGATVGKESDVVFGNSIVAGHTVGILNSDGLVTMNGTLWDGNGTNVVGTVDETGALAGTAAFAADGYHLTAVSAAIDAASDAGVDTDIDGQSRPYYGGYDLGADEWGTLSAVKSVAPNVAQPGQLVTYTIILTNVTDAIMMVSLTDTLPAEVNYMGPLSYTSGSGAAAGGVITWSGAVLTGTATTIRWPVEVSPGVASGVLIKNTAVISDAYGVFQTLPATIAIPGEHYLPFIVRNDS